MSNSGGSRSSSSGLFPNFDPADPHARLVIDLLWRYERTCLEFGIVDSDFSFQVLVPKGTP